MNKYYKPSEKREVVHVTTVKHGWRQWDNERNMYKLCFQDTEGARPFWQLGLQDGSVWEVDKKVFAEAGIDKPEPGAYVVQKQGKKTHVERFTGAETERATGEPDEGEAVRIAREIALLATMLLDNLAGGKQ